MHFSGHIYMYISMLVGISISMVPIGTHSNSFACSLCISQIHFLLLHILVGLGDYKLHPRFVYATRFPQDIHLINTYSPEESVEMVMLMKELEK